MTGWMETLRGIVGADDCDVNRHMSARAYFPRFDDGVLALFVAAGLFYGELHKRNLSTATVLHRIRYTKELGEGDPWVIEGAFARIGRSSLRLVQKMTNLTSGEVSASFVAVETIFDFTARKSTPIPDDLRARIQPLLVELDEADRALFGD